MENINILIIEDDEIIRMVLNRSLEKSGFNTFVAENGQEGLNCLKSKNDIHLIVTDIMMPIMNGLEMAHAIKDDPNLSHIPLIAMTAGNMSKELNENFYPFEMIFEKPIQFQNLLATISEVIELKSIR